MSRVPRLNRLAKLILSWILSPTFHEPCWLGNLLTASTLPQVCDVTWPSFGKLPPSRNDGKWVAMFKSTAQTNFIIEVSFFFLTLSSLSWSLKGNKIREILQESVKTFQSYSNSTKHSGERHSFKLQIFTLSFVTVFPHTPPLGTSISIMPSSCGTLHRTQLGVFLPACSGDMEVVHPIQNPQCMVYLPTFTIKKHSHM